MQDKDQKLICESYVKEAEYGPSGAPSLDVNDWRVSTIYQDHEWDDIEPNPWTVYVKDVLADLDRKHQSDEQRFIVFFDAPQGAPDYENWTDAGIVVAFTKDGDYSKGIFVDNDADGDPHVLPDQQIAILANNNASEIDREFHKDDEGQTWDPYGPEGVVSRSDFY